MGIYGICFLYIHQYAGYVNLPHLPLDTLKGTWSITKPRFIKIPESKNLEQQSTGPLLQKPEVALVSPIVFLDKPLENGINLGSYGAVYLPQQYVGLICPFFVHGSVMARLPGEGRSKLVSLDHQSTAVPTIHTS